MQGGPATPNPATPNPVTQDPAMPAPPRRTLPGGNISSSMS